MSYLLLAVLCSASIALAFRLSEKRKQERLTLTIGNYMVATLVAGVMLIYRNSQTSIFSTYRTELLPVLILGVLTGALFFATFMVYQRSVGSRGAPLAGAFAKMGTLVPMSLSLILWKETLSVFQYIGLGVALMAMLLMSVSLTKLDWRKIHLLLWGLLLMGGLADFSNKIFQGLFPLMLKEWFLWWIFFSALIFSSMTQLLLKKPWRWADWRWGLLIGVPNIFSSFFLIMALTTLPASITFPLFSTGTLLVIQSVSRWVYKERLSVQDQWGFVLAIVALLLLYR
jgi:drug/metabolite transporter (DMT)-like permease